MSAEGGHLETARLLLDSKADIHASQKVPPPLLPPHHGRAPRVGSAPVRVTCPPPAPLHSSSLPPPHVRRLVAGGRLRVGGREVRWKRWRAGTVRPGCESRDSDGSDGEGCRTQHHMQREQCALIPRPLLPQAVPLAPHSSAPTLSAPHITHASSLPLPYLFPQLCMRKRAQQVCAHASCPDDHQPHDPAHSSLLPAAHVHRPAGPP